jgi:hypothetical protein
LVLCVEDAKDGRRIVVDALNEQERTGTEGGWHDVRGTRLTTLDWRLNLVVVGIVIIVVASNNREWVLRAQVDDKARTPHGIWIAVVALFTRAVRISIEYR